MALVFHERAEDSPDRILRKLKVALDTLRAWGVRVPPRSRFVRAVDRIEGVFSSGMLRTPTGRIQQIQFDLREAEELIAIVASFPRKPGPVAMERLRTIVSGAESPDTEENSPGRDAQWELYLRALLCRAHIPVGLSSPDLIATIDGIQVPIEAKRPKREKRLTDRLREGVSQVEGRGHPGIIAFSLDRAIRDGKGILHGPDVDSVEHEVDRLASELIARQLSGIVTRVAGRPVLGLIFHVRMPAWLDIVGRSHLVTIGITEEVPGCDQGPRLLNRVIEGLSTGHLVAD